MMSLLSFSLSVSERSALVNLLNIPSKLLINVESVMASIGVSLFRWAVVCSSIGVLAGTGAVWSARGWIFLSSSALALKTDNMEKMTGYVKRRIFLRIGDSLWSLCFSIVIFALFEVKDNSTATPNNRGGCENYTRQLEKLEAQAKCSDFRYRKQYSIEGTYLIIPLNQKKSKKPLLFLKKSKKHPFFPGVYYV